MNNIKFDVFLNTLRQKGHLVYEYNPFHNFQTDVDLYIVDNKFIVPSGQAVNPKNGELLIKKYINYEDVWVDKRGIIIPDDQVIEAESEKNLWAKAGSLIDFDTDQLNFDIDHPVEIEVQPSYDGSVNLILNDDKNIPRLINSRFSVREKNTYEIVDRIGENDTNIYNSKTFDKDTSLYFQYEYNPQVSYQGFVKGQLQVGQYCFYFTYCDSDENESDFITETGLIPVFIGNDRDPMSMDGGIKNQSSHKGVRLQLSDLDKSYNYLKIYYVRYFADYQQNRVYECKKIYQKYPINSSILYLQITGYEEAEDIDANVLNISRFNPKNILTQAQCKNMLFFGNVVKNSDNYKELTDLALRIVPELHIVDNFDSLDTSYRSDNGDFAYYNSLNIYSKTGYFNQEYYRFGVVFIYKNGTLSNVYNTLGGTLNYIEEGAIDENNKLLNLEGELYSSKDEILLQRNYIKVDDFGWVKNDGNIEDDESNNKYKLSGQNINARGVCQLNYDFPYDDKTIFGIKFKVPGKVSKYLKEELGIRGLFFVRQKCIPNIIAQCYILPMDNVLEAPILESFDLFNNEKVYYTESFVQQDISSENSESNTRYVLNDYSQRLFTYRQTESGKYRSISRNRFAGICPDFLLNQPYYNQIFNGSKFKLQEVSLNNSELIKNNRFYEEQQRTQYSINKGFKTVTINTVTEENPIIAIDKEIFRAEIGKTEEAYRFRYFDGEPAIPDGSNTADTAKIARGMYSPYLAIYTGGNGELKTGCLYNIYQDSSISTKQEFQNRMDSSEPFYAISDRYNVTYSDVDYVCWRGDCYINQFTYRLNRNFNDPSLPNNDQIIKPSTWIDHYTNDTEEWKNISRSDINAVQLGSWITFRVRSAMNYALRSVDHSYVSEEALMGSPRSFYPRSSLLYRGENKISDSYLYNDAYRASLGFKCYFTLKDINYIKDTFSNRIQYSAISIQDSFKNNYRYSLSTYYRDYSQEYGSIQKLVGFEGYLLVVFEHGIGIAVVNERILAGTGDGEPVFVNTHNVLPEELTVISDTYGTQWGDSVIKSESGAVYGIDTIAKKIWRVKGQQLELLSDFKVNKFLIDNISLSEMELYPTVGLKNVKSHYNNNKHDIIFTFYDDVYKDEEKVWSLCYNELLDQFITFYSWVPSFSENIDTKFFTFNRNTAKELSLLAKCNYAIPENSGVLVEVPVIEDLSNLPTLHYITLDKTQIVDCFVFNPSTGTTTLEQYSNEGEDLKNGQYEWQNINFKLETDHWGNHKLFEIDSSTNQLKIKQGMDEQVMQAFYDQKVILLYVTPFLSEFSQIFANTNSSTQFKTEVIAITLSSIVHNPLLTEFDKQIPGLTTDFYLHGQAGIFNVVEDLYPTHWYGEYHPFEFEVIVNDKIGQQKIFENLILISNKAEPESFHFEIEGDNYEFSEDKRTMYFRQEATKELYQNLGSNILFNRYYTDVAANNYTYEQYYRTLNYQNLLDGENRFRRAYNYNGRDMNNFCIGVDKVYPIYSHGLVKQVKSTIFPLYYERVDTFNDIYHKYQLMHDESGIYDFQNLSGSEISWNRDLNQFNIITHVKNSPIDHVGRLRGNSRYKEGKWNIQIPSITFMQKNEGCWSHQDLPEGSSFTLCESKLCDSNNPLGCGGYTKIGEGIIRKEFISELPPLVINSQYIPKDIDTSVVGYDNLPNVYSKYKYNVGVIQVDGWTLRKETRIRDKWIKIRVRYSGKNLAIIHSLITLYNISYS